MTVANETNRTSAVGTAAAGQEISFSFPINATTDLVVKTRVTATGVESAALTENSDYTVEIDGDTGGTVTMVAAVAATSEIHVQRITPMTQSLNLTAGGTFSAENIEDALDKNCRIAIDNADAISRSLCIPPTDPSLDMELPCSVDRANNFLYFDGDGEPTVVATVAPSTAVITAFAETILDDTTAAAVRTTLGLVPGTDVQSYDADLLAIGALAKTDSNMIVGNGTTWVAESGATLRTSIGTLAETEACRVDASHAYTGTGVGFRDEDDMLSDDATAPPSQQSVRAFLYSIVTYAGDVLTFNGDVLTYV